jgi:hypothetical protein
MIKFNKKHKCVRVCVCVCIKHNFFWGEVRFELRACACLGRWCTTWATLPVFFCIGYFWDRILLYGQAILDCNPPIFAYLCSWDNRPMPPCPALTEMGSSELPRLAVFLFFGSTGVWTQGLGLARQVLYHSSHNPSPVFLSDDLTM